MAESTFKTDRRDAPIAESDPRRWIRRLSTGIASLLVLTSLTTLASGLHWGAELFVHFRLQYVGAAALLMLVTAALRFWPQFVAGAVVAGWHAMYVLPLFFGGVALEDSSYPLRLMHVNVLSSNDNHGALVAYIEEQEPDVVFLQEVTLDWTESLAEIEGYELVLSTPRLDNFGLAILHRQDVYVELGEPWVETFDATGVALPMAIQPLAVGGEKIAVLSVHTLPPAGRKLARARNRQLVWAARWAVETRERGVHPVIIGDLNTTPFSPYFRRVLRNGNLVNSQRGFGYDATWGVWPVRIPIDHALIDPELAVIRRRVGPNVGSDHRPLLLELAARAPTDEPAD